MIRLSLALGITSSLIVAHPVAHGHVSARDVVVQSAEAIGGVDRLRGVRAVRVDEIGGEYMVSTITRRDAPPRAISQMITTLRSAADSSLRRTMVQTFPMRSGALATVTVASHGVVGTVRGSTVVAGTLFDLMTVSEELALSPERVLLTALDAKDLQLQADSTIGGVRHHVVALGIDGAEVRLFIDAASSFPTHLELVRAYPTNVFWAMWGDLRFMTTWSAWSLEANGVWYPRQRSVTLNSVPFREYVVSALDLGASFPPDSALIPDSVRAMFAGRVAGGRGGVTPQRLAQVTPVEIAPNVVLYQGGYQSAALKQRDGVVVIEGPESQDKSGAVLADVAARWPGARVKAVVSTSPMWMHIGGLREYAARGIPIYALDVNVPVIHALLSASHRQVPDSLERVHVTRVVRPVSQLTVLGIGDERLELRPARGQHASSMLLAWLPGSRLLYASDVVVPDAFEPVFAAAYRAEVVRIVRREGLDVERVFGEHLPATPWSSFVK